MVYQHPWLLSTILFHYPSLSHEMKKTRGSPASSLISSSDRREFGIDVRANSHVFLRFLAQWTQIFSKPLATFQLADKAVRILSQKS